MSAINGFQPVTAAGSASAGLGASGDVARAAQATVSEIGQRVSAWVQALAPGGGTAEGGFRPDRATLSRGGDIYGLRQIADDLAGRFGASPTQAGDLGRALEGVARGAVVDAVLRHGAADAGAGLAPALEVAASAEVEGGGIEALTARLDRAAAAFSARVD